MTIEAAMAERYVVVRTGRNEERYWARFWRLRRVAGVHTVIQAPVVSRCPLLSAERAAAVAPPCGMQVPAETAWVPLEVDLPQFLCGNGVVDECRLQTVLRDCVDTGDRIHDTWSWRSADTQHDSWLNRRLAIRVTGIGDLAKCMGMSPESRGSLRFLNQLLLRIRQTLYARSRELALCSGPLPAISLSDPSLTLPRGSIRDDWQRRWRESVAATQVRHRNLLVLSPWSLFPGDEVADYGYSELLPLLRHADTCAFRRTVRIDHWKLNEFKRFHQRAMAVLQQRSAMSRFAKCI